MNIKQELLNAMTSKDLEELAQTTINILKSRRETCIAKSSKAISEILGADYSVKERVEHLMSHLANKGLFIEINTLGNIEK